MALRIRPILLLAIEFVAVIAFGAFGALLGVARPHAQSLGDLAKQEQARREAVKTPGKVYTNDDLKAVPAARPPDAGDSTGSADGSADAPAADGDTTPTEHEEPADGSNEPGKDAAVKDQKYWVDQMAALLATAQRDQTFADALQVQIDVLTTNFSNTADPAGRAVLGQKREKALADLEKLKSTLVDDQKAIDSLSDEARREGVPPGWLR